MLSELWTVQDEMSDGGAQTWMTLYEVVKHLRLSRSKLYDVAQGMEIPCPKVAGQCRFLRPKVDEWMLRQRPGASHEGDDD